ncbi:MAG TPA: ATP-binding protein [Mucilaginibacter sp.]|jgi:hypothetical protein|nr:ATP-binding protein [Mucilaginibacter sp.]
MTLTADHHPSKKFQHENAVVLNTEMQWLAEVIDARFKLYWDTGQKNAAIYDIKPPEYHDHISPYARFIQEHRPGFDERVLLALVLAPHISPNLLDVFFIKNNTYERNFSEFGGFKGQHHSGFIPTAETAAFILSGGEPENRLKVFELFSSEHFLFKYNILKLVSAAADEPFLSGILTLSAEYFALFTRGTMEGPHFSSQFPAKEITTEMNWQDLVLEANTLEAIEEIRDWIAYGDVLLHDWGMKKTLKPGYRTLFYGPPGTGKTLTASLLGKTSGLKVYRIDLSMMISKYIGETEKNLAAVFDKAEHTGWILFFDEADALFGKRTLTSSSNDRYANQEVSYLLQRIEDYPGIIILATNMKANMDEAFSRRFQSMIHFPMPGPAERLRLWQHAFPKHVILDDDIDLQSIAEKYELAGGAIINIIRYSLLKAVKRDDFKVIQQDLINGIKRELAKDGKTV